MEIPLAEGYVPYINTAQMVEVDRAMIETYQIELIQMMENAGRSLSHLARTRFLGGDPRGKTIIVLAGTGGNGGGAMVCARRLHAYGANVYVYLTRSDRHMTPVPSHQLNILRHIHVEIALANGLASAPPADLIIDGIIGYSLSGAPRGSAAEMIEWANGQENTPILSLDVPSGVDATTGHAYDPVVLARATMTLALPKTAFLEHEVADQVGELYLADIGVPPELYASKSLQLEVGAIFAKSDIVRLR